jgi:hypothetical protein
MTDKDREREHEREQAGHAERIAAIAAARDVAIMLALIGGAIAMAITEHGDLAFVMAGGALTYAVPTAAGKVPTVQPRIVPPQIVALAAGIGACALMSGCGGAPIPARAACRAAATTIALVCEHVPETVGGSTPAPASTP